MKNFMKKKQCKFNNKGFTIVELLIAFSILAIIVLIIGSFMASSSRLYNKTSADADIQTEAQLVANTISDLIIDCEVNIRYGTEVSEQVPGAISGNSITSDNGDISIKDDEEDPNDGKTLEIDNNLYQFLILNSSDNKLYYAERTADADGNYTGAFDVAHSELLAENVSQFSVDFSRLQGKGKENIVSFSLTYHKGNRSYVGTYQVALRNQITVNEVVTKAKENDAVVNKVAISPTEVYVTVKGKDDPKPIDILMQNFVATSDAKYVTSKNGLYEWELESGNGYDFTVYPVVGNQATINYDESFVFRNDTKPSFKVTVSSKIPNKTGGTAAAYATVNYKKIQDMNINAKSGITNGLASKGTSVTLSSFVDGWNLNSTDKYVSWKLQYRVGTASEWTDCSDKDIATLGTSRIASYIELGDKVDETYKFKVVATSQFDNSWYAEYEFGVYKAPDAVGNDDPSRGVEIDIFAYAKKHANELQNASTLVSISNVSVSNAPGFDETSKNMIKLHPDDGKYYLYLDYESYKYQSKNQLLNYYKEIVVDIKLDIVFKNIQGKNQTTTGIIYKLKLDPTQIFGTLSNDENVILPYGGFKDISFITSGYNITEKNQIGVYLDDSNVNANLVGMLDLNNYISANYTGSIGNRELLIKNGSVRLSSKDSNLNRPVGSTPLKITIDPMYRLATYANDATALGLSSIQYNLYVANVEGTDYYIPGPSEGTWSLSNLSASGYDCSTLEPSKVENAKIYAVQINGNDVYKLEIGSNVYIYNTTYKYWKKQ